MRWAPQIRRKWNALSHLLKSSNLKWQNRHSLLTSCILGIYHSFLPPTHFLRVVHVFIEKLLLFNNLIFDLALHGLHVHFSVSVMDLYGVYSAAKFCYVCGCGWSFLPGHLAALSISSLPDSSTCFAVSLVANPSTKKILSLILVFSAHA